MKVWTKPKAWFLENILFWVVLRLRSWKFMVHSEIKAKPGQLGWSWAWAWQYEINPKYERWPKIQYYPKSEDGPKEEDDLKSLNGAWNNLFIQASNETIYSVQFYPVLFFSTQAFSLFNDFALSFSVWRLSIRLKVVWSLTKKNQP